MPEQSSSKRRSSGGKSLSAADAAQRVRDELPALLGRPIETVLGVKRDEDSGWVITVAVVELSRIPNSTDILGAYQVTLDAQGELQGYQRQRRYNRSQADED